MAVAVVGSCRIENIQKLKAYFIFTFDLIMAHYGGSDRYNDKSSYRGSGGGGGYGGGMGGGGYGGGGGG